MSVPGVDRWKRIEQLFAEAAARPPAERARFLADACPDDAALRHEVDTLLAAQDEASNFLEGPPPASSALAHAGLALPAGIVHLAAGRRLGPYEIVDAIGAGGMGEVYRGRDTRLARTVAIKVLPGDVTHDAKRRDRFLQEARAASALNHPNIVTLHDIGSDNGIDFLVMEYVPDTPLDRLISSRPLSLAEALNCGIQIASALAVAHAAGIVHRDIKPANVMVTREGQVKVLDFGLAKWPEGQGIDPGRETRTTTRVSLTEAGQVIGTLAYMSPEQARGDRLDARTDLFSFGAVLYEMATGHPAFPKAFDWTPPPAAGLHPSLYKVILKLLEADREQRYASAQDVTADLKRLQHALQPVQSRRRQAVVFGLAAVLAASMVIAYISLRPTEAIPQSQWVQLTNLPDSATQPALSPDGRMLAFLRGPDTFVTSGQIYVKTLPDGEPVQLTRDNLNKMSPIFSPDSSQIAYTVSEAGHWDTWVVPLIGGQPRLWLKNASGLTWFEKDHLLFSEIKRDIHMAVVTAEENRGHARDIYVPAGDRGMAHRPYSSPDGTWALVVEMDRANWLPCRLVSISGKSESRQVGPPNAGCTSAAWSPDGRWMYVSSSVDGHFHIWRQRFPNGQLQQVTSGLTEEEGIAMAADGRSVITSVGLKQRIVWMHDSTGDRQISLEGYSVDPKLTPDGKMLCYRILKGELLTLNPSELRIVDVGSGRTEKLLPDLAVAGLPEKTYDISSDSRLVVASALDEHGKSRLWLAALDRQSPPRQIPNVEGDMPHFGPNGEVLFRGRQGLLAFMYVVAPDGTELRKLTEQPIAGITGRTPDGEWVVAKLVGGQDSIYAAFSVRDGSSRRLSATHLSNGDIHFSWSQDKFFVTLENPGFTTGRTYVIPSRTNQFFSRIPAGGFQSEAELSGIPGVQVIDAADVAPGPTPDMYAFSRETTQRNLYRIPIVH
jgi:serine/threonine protein kinase